MKIPHNIQCKHCVNKWCERVLDSPDGDMLRDCQYYKTLTNADRIRAMTDEEIVELLTNDAVFDSRYIIVCPSKPEGDCATTDCRECLLRWLKQDYK